MELLFAASKVGAVAVPLNWRLAAPELRAVLEDSRAPVLIAGPEYEEIGGGRRRLGRYVRGRAGRAEYEEWLGAHEPLDPGGRADAERRRPAALHVGDDRRAEGRSHHAPQPRPRARRRRPTGSSTGLGLATPLPMFHIGGIGWAFLGLWNGATTILVRDFDPRRCSTLLEREHVTNAIFVPDDAADADGGPGRGRPRLLGAALDRLRRLADHDAGVEGGARHVPLLALRGLRAHGDHGRGRAARPEDHEPGGPREHLLRSVGRPLPWVELRIADPATGAELAPREVGEVWLRAPNVTPGYFDRPEETAAALTPDGWLRTGDGGYVDEEGYLFLTDRIKDMIVSGGENVYPVEVEEALVAAPRGARGRRDRRAGRALGRDGQGGRRAPRRVRSRQPRSWSRSPASGSPATSSRGRSSSSTSCRARRAARC